MKHGQLAVVRTQASQFQPTRCLPRTTTKSAGRDSCFSAKEQSWRTAWRARSLLGRTTRRRTFADEGTGLVTLNTLNLAATITADGRTFRLRDVGGDLVRIEPDGTALLYITGQVPFAFAGVLIIDPETEEVILEPRDRSEEQVAKACKFLTGG